MYRQINLNISFREVSGSYAENQKIMTLRKVYQVCLKENNVVLIYSARIMTLLFR